MFIELQCDREIEWKGREAPDKCQLCKATPQPPRPPGIVPGEGRGLPGPGLLSGAWPRLGREVESVGATRAPSKFITQQGRLTWLGFEDAPEQRSANYILRATANFCAAHEIRIVFKWLGKK